MAALAAGKGAFREEEGTGGDAAAPQLHAPTSAPGARLSRLPLARVKALVKADPDVTLAGQEAIFILARAAELFVETIAKDAYCCAQQGKRKTLQRRDLGKVSLWYLGSGGRQERAGQGFPLHWLRRHHCKMSSATGLFLRCFLLGCHSARKPYLLKICFGWLERCWDREPKESRCCQS
uniref:DNA polymerase epsilon subunit 4 n=1 Tax=Balaenoptera musculus TaxID=9771 RepID=A0A8C0I117_BALMU